MIKSIPALVLMIFFAVPAQAADPATWPWYEVDANRQVRVNLYVFWSSTCQHCPKALEFARALGKKHPWVNVKQYEISGNAENLAMYRQMAESVKANAGMTPAFFHCKTATIGFDSAELAGARIEKDLIRWHDALVKYFKERSSLDRSAIAAAVVLLLLPPTDEPAGELPPMPEKLPDLDELALELQPLPAESPSEVVQVPCLGDVAVDGLSLPALTLILAGCDAFNPCAFFVLLTLLGVLVHGHSRARMLFVGGVFVAFSGGMYFLFMAAWLNLFFIIGELRVITAVAGSLAVGAAVLNIKDFWFFKTGPTLSIPESAKPGLFKRMGRLVHAGSFPALLAGTIGLAFAANLYELLCTAGFPMVYTRVLTMRELSATEYYGYLAFYNLVYVLPLAAIVTGFAFTLGSRKLSEYQGRVLKLFSGMMLLSLGGTLLLRPEWLQTAAGAVAVLGGSLIGTLIMIFGQRWCQFRASMAGKAAAGIGLLK